MKYVFLAYRSWAIKAISKFIDHDNFNYKIITTTGHEVNLSRFSKKNISIISNQNKDKINRIILYHYYLYLLVFYIILLIKSKNYTLINLFIKNNILINYKLFK